LSIAIAIVCKTPFAGQSKTRLSPPLHAEECAQISACFIRDLSLTIDSLALEGITGCAVYTPKGSEAELSALLPAHFKLVLQSEGTLGERLANSITDLLAQGHEGVVLVGSDSPTLPVSLLRQAVESVRQGAGMEGAGVEGAGVVLSPAFDGGYILIGLSQLHRRLFEDIPWSTDVVYEVTVARAKEIGLPVTSIPGWYDVDDEASLGMLEKELFDAAPSFLSCKGADAAATREFLANRKRARHK
jgi:uncharacterized protein